MLSFLISMFVRSLRISITVPLGPLLVMPRGKNFATAEMLLDEFGADPNTTSGEGNSVLQQAVQGIVAV